MKKIFNITLILFIAFAFVSCGDPIENASKAIEKENYVKAAKNITKLTVEDINEMEAKEQFKVFAICAAIEMSGDDEASNILNENLDLEKVVKKELDLLKGAGSLIERTNKMLESVNELVDEE
jgi:PBP1b-binding outer membrane lipoprotein LpoB